MASKGSETGVAARYALALFELADEQRKLDAVADDLKALDALIDENEDLQRMMASPVIGRAAQGASAADIHKLHMVPTPAAVLGVVLPYQAAIMSAADARSTSRTGD